MVHPVQPIIVAFGCTDTLDTFDPMLVRWSDQNRPGSWAVEGGSDAGGWPLLTGSEIVSAARSKREVLIWTDEAVYTMRYIGGELIFSNSEIATGVSIIGMNAYGVAGDLIFWMGDRNFYVYDSNVSIIPCTVLDYVFSDLKYEDREKVFAARNSNFGEIIWFYPSSSATDNDRYVIYNYMENTWAIGSMSRTAWSDSGIRQYPVAGYVSDTENENSILYRHEKGVNADGSAMDSYVESGFIDIDDGDHFSFVSRIIPDIRYTEGGSTGMEIKLTPKDFPGSSSGTAVTTSVSSSTTENRVRLRGRQLSVRLQSSSSDVGWVLGDTRIDIQPDGRR